jgi:hypothetical protein
MSVRNGERNTEQAAGIIREAMWNFVVKQAG